MGGLPGERGRSSRGCEKETRLQALFGGLVILIALLALLDGGPSRRRLFRQAVPLSVGARRGLMGLLVGVSGVLAAPALIPPLRASFFAFCGACPLPVTGSTAEGARNGLLETYLLGVWYYAATVIPVFVLACALSGALAVRRAIRVRGMLGAFGLAALLPVCSCGVIPLGKVMIDRGGPSVRSGLMFIAAAPLLSPIIIALGASVLGWGYVLVRLMASFVMAAVVALVVPAFLDPAPARASAESAAACGSCSSGSAESGGSALSAGWNMLVGLFRYVLYGVVIGALVAAALPSGFVARALSSGFLSMSAAVAVGVPVNLCAGEEVLLTAPLAGMGFTMGHAIAFALAGTGICVSSLPLLRAILGKRAMLAMVALYLVVPFALGVALTALPFTPRLEPRALPDSLSSIEVETPAPPQSIIDKSR